MSTVPVEAINEAKTVASLTSRELLTLGLLAAGGGLKWGSPHIGAALDLQALDVLMLAEWGRGLLTLGVSRFGMRLLFPWLDLGMCFRAAVKERNMPAAVVLLGGWGMLVGGVWSMLALK